MVERKQLKGVFKTEEGISNEQLELDYQEDPMKAYTKIIEFFNNTLRPYEKRRTVISAEWVKEKSNYYCDFEKTNMFTLKDSKGYYDRMKCKNCGKVRRRYGLNESPKVKCKGLK